MTQEVRSRSRSRKPQQKQTGFVPGLINLLTKQCIFAAMIFAALYYVKNANLPFSETVSSFIKNAVGYNLTLDAFIAFVSGIFV